MRRPVVLFVLLAAVAGAVGAMPADAWADAATEAHEAYDRGTRAYRKGDYATAAREYAAADALSPSPVALQAALDAAVLADDPVIGVELIDRAKGSPRTNALALSILTAQRKFARRTGRIHVACGGAGSCIASVDGAAVDPAKPVVVRVGAHTVIVESGGAATTKDVTVGPDEVIEVAPAPGAGAGTATATAPATAAAPASAPATETAAAPAAAAGRGEGARGISPIWFWVGLGATGIAGTATIVSGIDTANQHSSFASHCTGGNHAGDCDTRASNGSSAQTRTNVLLGVTAGLAVLTTATVFFVHWHDARVGVSPAGVAVTHSF
ncbi:MAG TPA: hypothetical protein VF765_07735 [Polyangiaceae bacterium]